MSTGLPLFVYGTLRPGETNHRRYLDGAIDLILPATVAGCLYLVEAEDYPYLLPGNGRVRGELIYVKAERFSDTLRRIDILEDYSPGDEDGSLYVRRLCRADTTDRGPVEAWTYYWNAGTCPGVLLAAGDFKLRGR